MGDTVLYRLFREGGAAVTADAAASLVLEFDCEVSAAVNDIVHQDAISDTKVIVNVNNTETKPSIGVIVEKITTTRCKVLILGIQGGYSGLSIGDKIFLDTDGTPTSSKPGTGYIQTLGIAVSASQIYFTPNATRVLQV